MEQKKLMVEMQEQLYLFQQRDKVLLLFILMQQLGGDQFKIMILAQQDQIILLLQVEHKQLLEILKFIHLLQLDLLIYLLQVAQLML